MKLYTTPFSANCRRVHATINMLEMENDVEYITPDIVKGDTHTPDYLERNPNGMVPCLEDGSFRLWESNAIMIHLANKKPGNSLYPNNPTVQSDVLRWMFWEKCHFNHHTGAIAWENIGKPNFMKQQPDNRIVETSMEQWHRFAKVLDRHLQHSKWLTGENITLADLSVGTPLMYAEMGKIPVGDYKNIKAWYNRIEDIPAYQKTAPPQEAAA